MPNETTRFADVVFPAAIFAEKDGTFTNSERRVQRVRKGVEPPGQARADWQILIDLANACGADWNYEDTAEIYDELARAVDARDMETRRVEIGEAGSEFDAWVDYEDRVEY